MENLLALNIEKTLERISNDKERLKELYQLSFDEFKKWKVKMREVIDSGDFESIRKTAHTYKGSSATIGAELAREKFLAIEDAAKAGTLDNIDALYEDAFQAVAQAERIMKEFLGK